MKDGHILLDEAVRLPEGIAVQVAVVENGKARPSLWAKLRSMAGTVEGPEDWAQNHDHYIHGTPKRP